MYYMSDGSFPEGCLFDNGRTNTTTPQRRIQCTVCFITPVSLSYDFYIYLCLYLYLSIIFMNSIDKRF